MEFHETIKAIREDNECTQQRLADLLGTTRQQIYKYEAGSQSMTIARLKQFCLVFGVSADYVLGLPKNLKWLR